jgi:uncharacterized protein (TIGR02271 family)
MSNWLANLSVGMQVAATDGTIGSIASVPRVDFDGPTSQSNIIVLANNENTGPGVEEFLRVPRDMVERIQDGVLYLNVPRQRVPRASAAVSATQRLRTPGETMTIQLSEEHIEVDTRVVERGYLRVQKKVDEYLDEQIIRLQHHETHIERVPRDEVIDAPIAPYMDGDVYVVPVIEEEIIIQTRLRLKEELRVHRVVAERDETIQTPFRRERLVVEEHRYDEAEPIEK